MKIIKRITIFFFRIYFHSIYKLKLVLNKKKWIYIFDIDNTLADTWPSFLENYNSERERYLKLSIFLNMRKVILKAYQKKENRKVIFLTARNYLQYFTTYSWLKNNKIPLSFFDLILTHNANEKVKLLKKFGEKGYKIIFVDDMTYNHENGEVKYYQQPIKDITNSYIHYFGVDKINKFNNSNYFNG